MCELLMIYMVPEIYKTVMICMFPRDFICVTISMISISFMIPVAPLILVIALGSTATKRVAPLPQVSCRFVVGSTRICVYIYIYIYIYIHKTICINSIYSKGYRLCRRPLISRLSAIRFGTNLGCSLEAFGHLCCHLGWSLQARGSIWARRAQPGCPNELFGIPVKAGAPI